MTQHAFPTAEEVEDVPCTNEWGVAKVKVKPKINITTLNFGILTFARVVSTAFVTPARI